MRALPLPVQQEALNARVNRKVKALLILSVVSMLATVLAVAAVYFRGPREGLAEAPQILGPDGVSVIGTAVVFTPDLAVCTVAVPPGALIAFRGSRQVPVTVVRSEALTPETKATLLRLQSAAPDPYLPAMLAAATSGVRAKAGSGENTWEGVLLERDTDLYDTEPAAGALGPGTGVYSTLDRSLVGMTARAQSKLMVVSTQKILGVFQELKGGQ